MIINGVFLTLSTLHEFPTKLNLNHTNFDVYKNIPNWVSRQLISINFIFNEVLRPEIATVTSGDLGGHPL